MKNYERKQTYSSCATTKLKMKTDSYMKIISLCNSHTVSFSNVLTVTHWKSLISFS